MVPMDDMARFPDVAAINPAFEERRVDGHHVGKRAVLGTRFLHQDLSVALDDLGLDFTDMAVGDSARSAVPARIVVRASRTHTGHNESVVRGQPPERGDVRSELFSSGRGAQGG